MTDVHDAVTLVEQSEAYARFREHQPEAYLAHAFCHVRSGEGALEIGYYSSEGDLVTVFTTSPVSCREPEEVFKEGGTVRALDLGQVSLGLDGARAIVARHCEQRYPYHPVQQEICVLQQGERALWNITLITATFHTVRLRLDASDGRILEEELRNLLDLR